MDWSLVCVCVCCLQSQGLKDAAQEVYEGLLQLEGVDPTLVSNCVGVGVGV